MACLAAVLVGACSTEVPTAAPSAPPSFAASTAPSASAAPSSRPTPTPTLAASAEPSPTGPAPSDTPPTVVAAWRARADVIAGPSAREDHTWTASEDGSRAYLFGGRGADGSSNELWQFDLASDSWSLLAPSGAQPDARFGHTATWVPGTGLVIWSGQAGTDFFADIWAYDPLAEAWRELASTGAVPPARYGSCAALGPDDRLWISHGFTAESGRFFDTRAYDFGIGEWSDMTPTGRVPVERCLHDCFWSAGGQLVLFAGQTTGVPALDDIWAYDLASGAWVRGPDADAPARQLHALTATDGGALVFGGGSIRAGLPRRCLVDRLGDAGAEPAAARRCRASAAFRRDDHR